MIENPRRSPFRDSKFEIFQQDLTPMSSKFTNEMALNTTSNFTRLFIVDADSVTTFFDEPANPTLQQ